MRFEGKVALVTGAGLGLGKRTAISLAREGARLILLDVNDTANDVTAKEIASLGTEALTLHADVSASADVDEAVRTGVERFGRLDVAINCAGVSQHPTPITETTDESFDHIVGIHLRGVFNCMRAELRVMERQGSGAIVNIGSVADMVGNPGTALYMAAKHGILGLTRSAALEFAARGIRINVVSPGGMLTEMFEKKKEEYPDLIEAGERAHPIGRIADVDEVARGVLFMASDEASYIIGQTLRIDGGYTVP